MNRRMGVGPGIILVLSLILAGCASQPTAEEVVVKMQEVEASIENAHAVAEFSVQVQGEELELVIEMWERSPSSFRSEVLDANKDDLAGAISVTDGQQVWLYSPTHGEAAVAGVDDLGMDETIDPRQIIGMMEEGIQWVLDTCEVELVGEELIDEVATYRLEFTPREEEDTPALLPPGTTATLWVEKDRWIVLQGYLDGGNLGQGWMRIRSFEFNEGVADELFQFEVPAGVEVIEVEDTQPAPLTMEEAATQAGFDLLVPARVPGGATLTDIFMVEDAIVLHYNHSSVAFTVVQREARDSASSDLQRLARQQIRDAVELEITVREQPAILLSDGQGNTLLAWTENGVAITIAGRIGRDDVIQVAESMQ